MTSIQCCVSVAIVTLVVGCLLGLSECRMRRREISTPESRIVFPDSSAVRFPGNTRTSAAVVSNQSNSNVIPVALFLKHSVQNADDFKDLIINKEDFKSAIPGSFSNNNQTIFLRANVGAGLFFPADTVPTGQIAEMAHCMPTKTAVELEKSSDPAVVYYPSCTRVERCGGCCMHDLLACEPTRTENITVKVIVARYDPDNEAFKHEGLQSVNLEKHLACECRCRVKASDCNALQDYHPTECKCICRNEDELARCSGEERFWDPRTCTCLCRTTRECSTGFFFDTKTCSCEPEVRLKPVSRFPNGMVFPDRNRQFTYETDWDSDERSRRNSQF